MRAGSLPAANIDPLSRQINSRRRDPSGLVDQPDDGQPVTDCRQPDSHHAEHFALALSNETPSMARNVVCGDATHLEMRT